MNNKVIYTAIFGKYDKLKEPRVIPEGFDFICFTDQDFVSDIWNVRKVKREFDDSTRCARQITVLPHKCLPEYEYSIWTDGNVIINGDMNLLLDKYLEHHDLATFDHVYTKPDSRDCIYEEAKAIISMNKTNYKDNEEIIRNQIKKYKEEGYPYNYGLVHSAVLFRRHNIASVVQLMEAWWGQIKNYSRRDQLSFNYVVWANKFKFYLIKENLRTFNFFVYVTHKNKSLFLKIKKIFRL